MFKQLCIYEERQDGKNKSMKYTKHVIFDVIN